MQVKSIGLLRCWDTKVTRFSSALKDRSNIDLTRNTLPVSCNKRRLCNMSPLASISDTRAICEEIAAIRDTRAICFPLTAIRDAGAILSR